jgi:hypothetical protein
MCCSYDVKVTEPWRRFQYAEVSHSRKNQKMRGGLHDDEKPTPAQLPPSSP